MSKKFKTCPYLWEVSSGIHKVYAIAETASEAIKVAECEVIELTDFKVKIVCFINEIINYK